MRHCHLYCGLMATLGCVLDGCLLPPPRAPLQPSHVQQCIFFARRYKLILAAKLLSNIDYETEKEVRNLELLKLRFGESNMHSCEIMLKDVSDSKARHVAYPFVCFFACAAPVRVCPCLLCRCSYIFIV